MARLLFSLFFIVILSGCHSSGSLQKEQITINKKYQPILLLPFVVSEHKITSSDASSRDKGEAKLAQYLDDKYKLYTYSFDDRDFDVLRDSILFSLNGSIANNDSVDKSSSGHHSLKIEFSEFGIIADGKTSKCLLHGKFFLNDKEGNPLKVIDFNVEYESAWSVAASKDGAVKELLKSLEMFLQS